ncbi:hypothetical protein GDO86_008538 [Hymenochirus boettgeri]|uniref:Large ribosomal subunit protein uL11m n=1 Tax=Hymenochirus boettgeri TaxID=247094 RepID=A0A8T2J226_9PIPI|nr:hypothetical protein GDO86_008538 [Hymenochirus boettgeri]
MSLASRAVKTVKKASDSGVIRALVRSWERGIPIGQFCKEFNEKTKDIKDGIPLPVKIFVKIGQPPVSYFLKAAAGIEKGAAQTGREVAGMVTLKHLYEIALVKSQDEAFVLRDMSLHDVVKCIMGSAKSLGIKHDSRRVWKVLRRAEPCPPGCCC